MRQSWSAAIVGALFLAACGQGEARPDASDPIFLGLDHPVVVEVLANPTAADRASGDRESALTLWQGMVRNFSLCRAGYTAYTGWLKTGSPGILPALPVPANPRVPASADDVASAEKAIRGALIGGDISVLRDLLTNDSGCGAWIPAKPNDSSGPTIAQAVQTVG